MVTHLRFNPDGHSSVSESILAVPTGTGPVTLSEFWNRGSSSSMRCILEGGHSS